MAGEDEFATYTGTGTAFQKTGKAAEVINAPASSVNDPLDVEVGGTLEGGFEVNGELETSAPVQTTAPAAGAAAALPATPKGYVKVKVDGVEGFVAYY